MLHWLVAVNILPILALISFAVRPARFAVPWLGLATIVVGTAIAFNSSATFYSDRSIGVGIGWLITTIYGFIGLGIVVCYVQFRAVPFVPLGAIIAGVIHIASFYAFIPPLAVEFPGMLPFAAPGFLLIAYGVYLWYRYGIAESMEHRSPILRVLIGLVIVAGLGSLGFLQFERPGPGRFFADAPDLPQMVSRSALIVEGMVVDKEPLKYKSRDTGNTSRFTLYTLEASYFLRGSEENAVRLVVRDRVPLELKVGNSYLIFSRSMSNLEELADHWRLREPVQVWTAEDGVFHPYPGLPREAPIMRESVAKLLESNPYIGN